MKKLAPFCLESFGSRPFSPFGFLISEMQLPNLVSLTIDVRQTSYKKHPHAFQVPYNNVLSKDNSCS